MSLPLSAAAKGAVIVWRITGALDPTIRSPQVSTIATFTTTANTANPGSSTPFGGSQDYLWIAFAGLDSETAFFTAGPSGYSNLISANSGTAGAVTTNCILAGASRQLTAASEDPGVFTHPAAASGGSAWTVGIPPAPTVAVIPDVGMALTVT